MREHLHGARRLQGERVRQEKKLIQGKDLQLPEEAYRNPLTHARKVQIACQLTEFTLRADIKNWMALFTICDDDRSVSGGGVEEARFNPKCEWGGG